MADEQTGKDEGAAAEERFGTPDISVPVPLACMASYFIPVIGGLFFLFVEKGSRVIRFHAAQSILFWIVAAILLSASAAVGSSLLSWLVSVILLISWSYVMYESLFGNICRLPVIGDLAYRMIFEERG